MANYTSNYKLTKPLPNELYSIDIQNNNMDTIDKNLKEASNVANEGNTRSKTNASNLEALKSFKEDPFEETGAVVQVDLFQDAPLNVVSKIEPIQSGSGDPYPAGGGKNLIPYPYPSTTTSKNGIAFNYLGDGRISIKGTATADTPYFFSDYTAGNRKELQAGTYTISGNPASNISMSLYLYDTQTTGTVAFEIHLNNNASQTFTIDKTMYYGCYVWIPNGKVVDTVIAPQIEKGSAATEFAPYSNIRPITGRTVAELVRCGKNLVSFATVGNMYENAGVSGTFDADGVLANGTPTINYAKIVNEVIKLPKGRYYVSGGELTKMYLQVSASYADGSVKHYSNSAFDITGEETRIQVMIQTGTAANVGTLDNYRFRPMLVVGDAAPTNYEPYSNDTFSANFGQTVYGGTMDWNTGVLTVDRGVLTLTGNEAITTQIENDCWNRYNCSAISLPTISPAYTARCSHFKTRQATMTELELVNSMEIHGVSYYPIFRVDSSKWGTVELWKSYLASQYTAGTPVQICYELVEPTVIQLTPQEISALAGCNTLYSDCGETIVSGRKDIIWLTHSLIKRIEALEAQVAGL